MAAAKKQKKSVKKFSPLVSVRKFSNKQLGLLVAAVALVGVGLYFVTHAATSNPILISTLKYDNATHTSTTALKRITATGSLVDIIQDSATNRLIDNPRYSSDRTLIAWWDVPLGAGAINTVLTIYNSSTKSIATFSPSCESNSNQDNLYWIPGTHKIAYLSLNTCTNTPHLWEYNYDTGKRIEVTGANNLNVSGMVATANGWVILDHDGSMQAIKPGVAPVSMGKPGCTVQSPVARPGKAEIAYFCYDTDGLMRIYRQKVGGGLKQLNTIDPKVGGFSGLAWSPDGSQMAILTYDQTSAQECYFATKLIVKKQNYDGSGLTTIFSDPSTPSLPGCTGGAGGSRSQFIVWSDQGWIIFRGDTSATQTTRAGFENSNLVRRISASASSSSAKALTNNVVTDMDW